MRQMKKPPQGVANAVSVLIYSGQDTIRLDEKFVRSRSKNLISESTPFGVSTRRILFLI